jgi:leucyl aminopeptidase
MNDDPIVADFRASADVPRSARVLGVPVFDNLSMPDGAGASLERRFLVQRRFEGKPGQALALLADDGSTIVALGVGKRGEVDQEALRKAAAALARHAGNARHVATTLMAAGGGDGAEAIVEGFALASYRYAGRPGDTSPVDTVTVVGASSEAVRRGRIAAVATCRARDWVNRPPRDLTPDELSRLAVQAADDAGLDAEVWGVHRIEEERLGGLLGVAAGAAEHPRLIRLEHRPPEPIATIHLVGKGITFDSGGLSLKTPQSMIGMKADMGGAAAVLCAAIAVGELEVPVNVVAWVAATENMPSGTAIHPGDVLTARNGKTIEVINTDAEGRLVLADALSLAVEGKPDAIIDVATLTGGQRVALGPGVAAVMSTDDDLVGKVISAAEAAGEPAWQLPLFAPYRRKLDSEVADLKNVTGGTAASTIMAGLFLREFVGDVPWAHLDIADPSWSETDEGWLVKGATGWGTRTLIELISRW